MFSEIFKLASLLLSAGLPFSFKPCQGGFQIRLYADSNCTQEIDDCICHPYSIGYKESLLETYLLNDCAGYETAEQVFEGWTKMYADAQ